MQHVANKAFIIEGHLGQVTGFAAPVHISTPIVSFIPLTLLLVTWNINTSSIMIEQTIIQAELLDGTNSMEQKVNLRLGWNP